MDNELKVLADNHKIEQLYNNNLFSVKSISELLGTWESYSDSDKFSLENLTRRDSNINKNFTYQGGYDRNLTYGELSKSGVEELISGISKYKNITEKDVFVDIGSGTGKLILHMGIKSSFKTLVGIEVQKERHLYSKYIKERILPENNSVFFLNKSILDFDLSIGTVFFMNDVSFSNELSNQIFDRLPFGSHFITHKNRTDCKILKEVLNLGVTWQNKKATFNYYIKY